MTGDRPTPAPPSAPVAGRETPREAYFTVGALKLALMSLTTFGLYELYWFYQNWRVARDREQSSISPFWRAVFTPLWTFDMGDRFVEQAKAERISIKLPTVVLGILYIALRLPLLLPEPYKLARLVAVVAILPFDYAARRLDGEGRLAAPTYGRYSGWNVAWLIVGSLLLLLAIIGAFLPQDAP